MAQQKIWLQWNNDSLYWTIGNDYVWSEVFILIEIAEALGGGGGGVILPKKNPWEEIEKFLKDLKYPEKKTEKFLEIVVKVNGLETTEKRQLKDVKKSITVDHIKKTLSIVAPSIKVVAADVKKQ